MRTTTCRLTNLLSIVARYQLPVDNVLDLDGIWRVSDLGIIYISVEERKKEIAGGVAVASLVGSLTDFHQWISGHIFDAL